MKRKSAFGFALLGTALLLLAFIAGRFIYINVHTQTFEKITKKASSATLSLYENESLVRETTDSAEIEAIVSTLSTYTYTEYKHFFKPAKSSLTQNRLRVVFDDGTSIAFSADGYVFVNDKLRDVSGSRGQELYQKLYAIYYPSAIAA